MLLPLEGLSEAIFIDKKALEVANVRKLELVYLPFSRYFDG